MPYPGIPAEKTSTMEKCVSKVMASGKDKSSAIAICHTSIMGSMKMKDKMGSWTTAFKDSLPDSSFAYIVPGGKKDSDGKTVPRSNRKLPYKDENGKPDLDHVRNALARLSQTQDVPADKKDSIRTMLENILKKQKSGSEKPKFEVMLDLADYMKASEDGTTSLPTEIQVLPIGMWDTEQYGPMSITRSYLAQVVENFKKNLRKGLPIDINHDGKAAAGWMTDLTIKEDGSNPGLYAKSEWTPLGEDNLIGKIYRFFSPEWSDDYVDPETGIHYGPTLIAGTLTNRPLFKELTPLVAHEKDLTNTGGAMVLLPQTNYSSSNNIMTQELKDVLAKEASELTAEDKALIIAHEADLDDAQKETFKDVLANKTADEGDDTEGEDEKKDEEQADDTTKTAEEKTVTLKASEVDEMRTNAEAGKKAMEILQAKEASEQATSFLIGSEGGKVLPVAKDVLTKFIRSMSETQMKYFSEVMKNVPDAKYFSEIGSSEALEVTAQSAFEQKVSEIMKANEGMTEGQAQLEVAEKHPDLYKAYEEGLQPVKRS